MSGLHKAKSSKKNRKHGRSVDSCKRYAASHQQEKNKLRKLAKHLKLYPNDASALAAVKSCKVILGVK